MFKKILLLVILATSVVGCTAEDIAIWKDSDRRMAEKEMEVVTGGVSIPGLF